VAALRAELRALLAAPEALIPAVLEDLGNPAWDDAAQRVLIVRLSPLEDVAGSQAHLFLFTECRKALGLAFIDLAFLPSRADREILSARGLPYYYGLASGRPPEDFDLILVSNAFSLELVNLGYLFSERLPSRASERARRPETTPIVILGGSNASACGSLLLPGKSDEAESDSLVDGIFFGEGEASGGPSAVARLASALAGDPHLSREARLSEAARVRGFWPALSGLRVERSVARPYPAPLLRYPVLNTREAGIARLQISAGCPGLCSFCLEGWDRRPYREAPAELLVEAARELRAESGAETLEVYSFNFNTHSSILDLVFELGRIYKRVNLMSQRLDILARRPALLAAELAADKRSFTLGVEGVSRRMRAYYRKGLGDGDIEAAAAMLMVPGVREIKLFFIIAGIEDEEDLAELASFAARLSELKSARASGARLLASAGFLVRLPGTPLQYAPLCLDRGRLQGTADRMRAICETAGIEFRLAADYEEYLSDQLICLGGRALAPWIEAAASEGRIFDGGLSRGAARSLESFAAKAGLLGDEFPGEKGGTWAPPLSFALGDRGALLSAYRLAAEGRDRRPCLGIDELSPGSCERCGACDDPDDVGRLTGHAIAGAGGSGAETASRIARIVEAKRRLPTLVVRVELPESLGRATAEYRASWLARLIASKAPRESRAVLELSDALFGDRSSGGAKGRPLGGVVDRYWGRTLYAISCPDLAMARTAALKAGLVAYDESSDFSRVEIEVSLPASFAVAARKALYEWLEAERVDVVETRRGGARRLECSAGSAKKRVLYSAELLEGEAQAGSAPSGPSFVAKLVAGPKASIADWLRSLPPGAERSSSVRIVSW
jgi:radical SAM superfamily enzyme YgiQ (UPF0313 family)